MDGVIVEVTCTGMLLCGVTTGGTVAAGLWAGFACCCTGSISGDSLICCRTAAAQAMPCVRAGCLDSDTAVGKCCFGTDQACTGTFGKG